VVKVIIKFPANHLEGDLAELEIQWDLNVPICSLEWCILASY